MMRVNTSQCLHFRKILGENAAQEMKLKVGSVDGKLGVLIVNWVYIS